MTSCRIEHLPLTGGIPDSLAQELANSYESAFSLSEYFAVFHRDQPTDAIRVIPSDNVRSHLIFYRTSNKDIYISNALVRMEADLLNCTVEFLFAKYPRARRIEIDRIMVQVASIKRPYLLRDTSEDIVLSLPSSPEEYDATLGRRTRTHLRYYLNKLARENPNFSFLTKRGEDIDEAVVRRIIQMNRLRMESKKIVSGYDKTFESRIVTLCRSHGLVGILSVGGQVIAGTICYAVGKHVYLEAVSHDPEYNKMNSGQICLNLTIKDIIRGGFSTFHMLWGEYEYKYRFGGRSDEHYFLSIYRDLLPRYYAAGRKRAGEVMNVLRYHVRRCFECSS